MISFREAALRDLYSPRERADVLRLPSAWMNITAVTLAVVGVAVAAGAASIAVPVYAEVPAILVPAAGGGSSDVAAFAVLPADKRDLFVEDRQVHLHLIRHPGARFSGRLTRVAEDVVEAGELKRLLRLAIPSGSPLSGGVTLVSIEIDRAGLDIASIETSSPAGTRATASLRVGRLVLLRLWLSHLTSGKHR
ncbi:MAG: hypothetical protein GEU99_14075 [Luteitalea sp.]|nr:hypothetical protein [Luteitalea sp.]